MASLQPPIVLSDPGGRPRAFRWVGRAEMLVVVDQGLVSAGNFALTASVARLLPLSDFGRYMLIMTVVWLFTDLQVATVTGPYTINRPKLTAARRGPFFGSIVLHQGVVLMAAMLAAAMTAGTQSGAPGGSAITVVAAAALSVVGLLIRDQMRRLFIVHQQLVDCLKYDGVVLALHGTAVLAGVASGHFSLVWAYGSAAFACAIPSLHWLRRLGPVHRRPTLAWRHWKLNWGVGKWMVLSGVMWSLATYLYPWTITAAHGTTETGLWAAALGLSSLCNVPLGGLQNHYAVRIAAASTADLGGEVLGSAVRLAGLAFCFVVLFALVGGQLMGLLYGDRFVPAAPLTTLMAMNLLVGSVSFCVSRGLFAIGRGGADCTVNTVPLMVFVVCGAWATVSFGPLGAVASFLASNVVALAFRAAVLRRALAHRPVVTSVRSP